MPTPLDALRAAVAAEDEEGAEAAIEDLRPADEPALLAGLALADNDLTWWSLYALSRCGTAAGVPALVARLQDDDAAIRSAAALALAHIQRRDSSIVPFVAAPICALLTDEVGYVRQTAADALSICGDAAVPALAAALKGEHEGARARAMMALRKIGSLEAAKIMYLYLNDPNYLVQTVAYEGLDEMGLLENILLKP
jgi:HEAT repeat protein